MKLIYLLLFVTVVTSCKKENRYPIVGKWQEVKLRTYTKSYGGVISNDTTYLRASFNSLNYAQFNNEGTCIIGLYYPPNLYDPRRTDILPSTESYDYKPIGAVYVLFQLQTLINPGGFSQTDTASVSSDTLLIHQVFDGHANYQVSDSYYTR